LAEEMPRRSRAGQALLGFWIIVILAAAAGAVTLQQLGPPSAPATVATASTGSAAPAASPAGAGQAASGLPPAEPRAGTYSDNTASPVGVLHPPGSAIAPPDPALLEPSRAFRDAMLPRIGAGHRMPMQVYAGGVDPQDKRPRIALILGGIGQSDTDSEDAIRQTPAGVTLAVSPYSAHPQPLLEAARARGHEFLLAIPMEPQSYPMNEAGPESLLTGAGAAQNRERLEWAMSRIAGYAGATGAFTGMGGERFAASTDQLGAVEHELAARGLFYIDPRPGKGAPTQVTGRDVDLVLDDEPALASQIDSNLAKLERIARDRGSAVGLAELPFPVTVERIAAWASGLEARGIILVPASALALPPRTGGE
jgi:polysaccharide deacetylase 2 family uncharacterized protein YibQ